MGQQNGSEPIRTESELHYAPCLSFEEFQVVFWQTERNMQSLLGNYVLKCLKYLGQDYELYVGMVLNKSFLGNTNMSASIF